MARSGKASIRLCAGGVIGLARRLDRGLRVAAFGRGERVLEAADRRAKPAACLRQSLGAEHDQPDDQDQEEVSGAEDVLDHVWSLWVRYLLDGKCAPAPLMQAGVGH